VKAWITAVPDTHPALRLTLFWRARRAPPLRGEDLAPLVRCARPTHDGAVAWTDPLSAARIAAGVNHFGPYVAVECAPTLVRFEFYGVWRDDDPSAHASQRAFERLLAHDDAPCLFEAFAYDPDGGDASTITSGPLTQLRAAVA
jgi:hypothetical protein